MFILTKLPTDVGTSSPNRMLRLRPHTIFPDRTGHPVFTSIRVLQLGTHIANKPRVREVWGPLQPGFSLLPDRLCRGQIRLRWTQGSVKVLSGKPCLFTHGLTYLMCGGEVASRGCPEILGDLSAP